MTSHRPNTKGYLRENGKTQFVGAEDLSAEGNPYRGPCAEITYDDTFLHIVTDRYEGHAMLNIEALPFLRKALARISRKLQPRK